MRTCRAFNTPEQWACVEQGVLGVLKFWEHELFPREPKTSFCKSGPANSPDSQTAYALSRYIVVRPRSRGKCLGQCCNSSCTSPQSMRLEHMELTFGNATHKFAVSFPPYGCSKCLQQVCGKVAGLVPPACAALHGPDIGHERWPALGLCGSIWAGWWPPQAVPGGNTCQHFEHRGRILCNHMPTSWCLPAISGGNFCLRRH